MTFGEALKIRQQNQADDVMIKLSTRHYWNQIFVALLKARQVWPIGKSDASQDGL